MSRLPFVFSVTTAIALAITFPLSAPAHGAPPAKPPLKTVKAVSKPIIPALSPAEQATQANLRAETIRDVTTGLADPKFAGRGTAQLGGEAAAAYLADRFRALGLKPLGDNGGYLQGIKFTTKTVQPTSSITAGSATLTVGPDFISLPLPFDTKNDATGDVVFVGYGVAAPALKHDDLAGIDVRGKVVVVLSGRPKNIDAAAWKKTVGDGQSVFQKLIFSGAAAVMIINAGTPDQPYALLADYLTRRQTKPAPASAGAVAPAPPFALPPILLLSDAGAEKLFAGSGTSFADLKAKAEDGDSVSRGLGTAATIAIKFDTEEGTGSNVVGFLEGSDPKLKSEAVIISAHYDGWGTAPGGKVFPGAADNALGVAEMTAIAEALVKSPKPPRRSLIFLAFTGEEHGLFGSEYWVRKPTWPLANVVADLNFDGVGSEIFGPVKTVAGYGTEYSTLGTVFTQAVAAEGGTVVPDPMPEEHAFERSDHFTFVKKGVPALMPLGGQADVAATLVRVKKYMKDDYHQPSDVIRPDWNWDGAKTIASILLLMSERVANADARPTWLPAGAQFAKGTTPEEPKQ